MLNGSPNELPSTGPEGFSAEVALTTMAGKQKMGVGLPNSCYWYHGNNFSSSGTSGAVKCSSGCARELLTEEPDQGHGPLYVSVSHAHLRTVCFSSLQLPPRSRVELRRRRITSISLYGLDALLRSIVDPASRSQPMSQMSGRGLRSLWPI